MMSLCPQNTTEQQAALCIFPESSGATHVSMSRQHSVVKGNVSGEPTSNKFVRLTADVNPSSSVSDFQIPNGDGHFCTTNHLLPESNRIARESELVVEYQDSGSDWDENSSQDDPSDQSYGEGEYRLGIANKTAELKERDGANSPGIGSMVEFSEIAFELGERDSDDWDTDSEMSEEAVIDCDLYSLSDQDSELECAAGSRRCMGTIKEHAVSAQPNHKLMPQSKMVVGCDAKGGNRSMDDSIAETTYMCSSFSSGSSNEGEKGNPESSFADDETGSGTIKNWASPVAGASPRRRRIPKEFQMAAKSNHSFIGLDESTPETCERPDRNIPGAVEERTPTPCASSDQTEYLCRSANIVTEADDSDSDWADDAEEDPEECEVEKCTSSPRLLTSKTDKKFGMVLQPWNLPDVVNEVKDSDSDWEEGTEEASNFSEEADLDALYGDDSDQLDGTERDLPTPEFASNQDNVATESFANDLRTGENGKTSEKMADPSQSPICTTTNEQSGDAQSNHKTAETTPSDTDIEQASDDAEPNENNQPPSLIRRLLFRRNRSSGASDQGEEPIPDNENIEATKEDHQVSEEEELSKEGEDSPEAKSRGKSSNMDLQIHRAKESPDDCKELQGPLREQQVDDQSHSDNKGGKDFDGKNHQNYLEPDSSSDCVDGKDPTLDQRPSLIRRLLFRNNRPSDSNDQQENPCSEDEADESAEALGNEMLKDLGAEHQAIQGLVDRHSTEMEAGESSVPSESVRSDKVEENVCSEVFAKDRFQGHLGGGPTAKINREETHGDTDEISEGDKENNKDSMQPDGEPNDDECRPSLIRRLFLRNNRANMDHPQEPSDDDKEEPKESETIPPRDDPKPEDSAPCVKDAGDSPSLFSVNESKEASFKTDVSDSQGEDTCQALNSEGTSPPPSSASEGPLLALPQRSLVGRIFRRNPASLPCNPEHVRSPKRLLSAEFETLKTFGPRDEVVRASTDQPLQADLLMEILSEKKGRRRGWNRTYVP